ncbi:MAG: hypothetical protein R3F59_16995, partial [Myxococcota bacterium]
MEPEPKLPAVVVVDGDVVLVGGTAPDGAPSASVRRLCADGTVAAEAALSTGLSSAVAADCGDHLLVVGMEITRRTARVRLDRATLAEVDRVVADWPRPHDVVVTPAGEVITRAVGEG